MQILITLLGAAAASGADTVTVQTLTGESIEGRLAELRSDAVVVEAQGEPRSIAVDQLQFIQFGEDSAEPAESPTRVELIDRSQLAATSYAVDGQTLRLGLGAEEQIELPVRNVRAVCFKSQNDEQLAQWNEIVAARVRSDLLVIRKNDRIDYLEGVLRNVGDGSVQFELDGEIIPVKLEKVEGLVYYRAASGQLAPSTFRAVDRFGSQIVGSNWTVTDSKIELQTPSGVKLERSFDQLRRIDFSADKIVFLSDLQPVSVQWMPYFSSAEVSEVLRTFYRPKMDRSLMRGEAASDDGKLQLQVTHDGTSQVVSYEKGIAIHSQTSLVFELPVDAQRFQCLAGIDARVRQFGHVKFVIRGDGGELWAKEIAGSDEPLEIALDVTGVRRLELFVDFGENMHIGDHLNLCKARIIK